MIIIEKAIEFLACIAPIIASISVFCMYKNKAKY